MRPPQGFRISLFSGAALPSAPRRGPSRERGWRSPALQTDHGLGGPARLQRDGCPWAPRLRGCSGFNRESFYKTYIVIMEILTNFLQNKHLLTH